ncbi:MAG: heme-binding domain-containing protein [Bacteroidota bacterium]
MKKLIKISLTATSILIFMLVTINLASAQKTEAVGKPIPDAIVKITKKSCATCHAEPAGGMAISVLNLSKWDAYPAKKQASKAEAICNKVSKDKMPPKKFKEKHPEAVLTKEEIKAICDWAATLNSPKKK